MGLRLSGKNEEPCQDVLSNEPSTLPCLLTQKVICKKMRQIYIYLRLVSLFSLSAFNHDPEHKLRLSVTSRFPVRSQPGHASLTQSFFPAALPCSAMEGQHGLGVGHWLH